MVKWSGITYKVNYKWRKLKQRVSALYYQFRDMLVFYLPSQNIRDLPKKQALTLGVLSYVLISMSCGYLFYSTINRNLKSTYLALSEDSNSICDEILRDISGTYHFDTEGYWLGNREYNYSHGLYEYQAQLKQSFEEYQQSSKSLAEDILQPIGVYMQRHNLGMNLLLLMTYQVLFTKEGNFQDTDAFLFTTTPSNIFNNGVYSGAVGAVDSICDVQPAVVFDRANSQISLHFDYAAFQNSSACMNALDPKHFGYDAEWSGGVFEVAIDLNTMATTLAVNLNILPEDNFERIDPNPYLEGNGGQEYFFTQFKSMKPFTCFEDPEDSSHYACFMKIGELYAFPIFNHGGYNSTYPRYCDCDDREWSQSQMCNRFHFLSGLLFYDYNATETASDSLNRLLELMFSRHMTSRDINRKAFDISYDISNPASTTRGDQDWKNEQFAFCRSSDGNYCSVMPFYKTSNIHSVTDFHFSVYNGSCNDFVSLSDEAAERLSSSPPATLVEPYMKCRRTIAAALNDTVGIVSGNMSALVPVLMLLIFYLYFYCFIQCKHVKQDVTYSKHELDSISKFLTFNLALARDGLHPTQLRAATAMSSDSPSAQRDGKAILGDSVLLRLLEELKQEEVQQRFHAPLKGSDDEDEGEGEAGEKKKNLASSTNPMMTDGRYSNSTFDNTGNEGLEMRHVDAERGWSQSEAAKKRRQSKQKKKKPAKTNPDVLLNPLVYRLDD